eukprot:365534-Chlamydomonas_euryale.AAC.18
MQALPATLHTLLVAGLNVLVGASAACMSSVAGLPFVVQLCPAGRLPCCPVAMAIRFLLLQNRAGKTRLAKYYVPVKDTDKAKLEYDVHRAIVNRDPKHTNFSEVRVGRIRCATELRCMGVRHAIPVWSLDDASLALQFRTHKVVYRRYAGLFFTLCVDVNDNELLYLEAIHLFVEILDHYFQNVCELDLVSNARGISIFYSISA